MVATVSGGYTAPDFSSIALITIDVQVDTLDGQPLEIPGTSAALPAMKTVVEAFRAAGRPIAHVVRLYQLDGSNVDPCRRALVEDGSVILAPGAPGSELAAGLLPSPDIRLDSELLLSGGIQEIAETEVVIYKPRWGAFFGTALEEHVRARDVSTLAFCGCNFPNCPRTSIYEASERDFRVVMVTDAVSGVYERGLAELQAIGVNLLDSAELATALAALAIT
jgi:nicotinamidase-related amidase